MLHQMVVIIVTTRLLFAPSFDLAPSLAAGDVSEMMMSVEAWTLTQRLRASASDFPSSQYSFASSSSTPMQGS